MMVSDAQITPVGWLFSVIIVAEHNAELKGIRLSWSPVKLLGRYIPILCLYNIWTTNVNYGGSRLEAGLISR